MALFKPMRALPTTFAEWSRYFNDASKTANLTRQQSFVGSLTGFAAPLTPTIYYAVAGDLVVMEFPNALDTSTNNALALTGMPAAIKPARNQYFFVLLRDNGTDVICQGRFLPTDPPTITFSNGVPAAVFTTSGSKGLRPSTAVYMLT